jgi:DNA-binding CsgD family transcriptional regulator
VKTVKAHLSLIFQKLGVKRRSELALIQFLP